MAPNQPTRRMIHKDRFSAAFSNLKTQTYYDPAARGPGSHTLRTLSWNPTGTLIATGSADRTLRIWNPERSNVKYSTELRGHTGGIEKVAFNPVRESEVASCSSDGTVRFWDVRSKNCVRRVEVGGQGVDGGCFTMSWSADGKVVLVGKKNDELIPISISNSNATTTTDGDVTMTNGATTTATSITASTSISTFTLPQSEYTIHPPQQQSVQTNATTFSHHTPSSSSTTDPSYDIFLTTGLGTVNIASWSPTTTTTITPYHTLHAHTSACVSLSLSPNGHYLAIGGSDALISLWDTSDWHCARTLSSPSVSSIRDISWSWDGRFVIGATDELGMGSASGGTAQLEIYHAETGESVAGVAVKEGLGVPAVAWHPSRYVLAYSVTDAVGLRIVGW